MSSRFKRILKECGLRDIRFNVLRHICHVLTGIRYADKGAEWADGTLVRQDYTVHLSDDFKEVQLNGLQYADSELLNRQKNGQNDAKAC